MPEQNSGARQTIAQYGQRLRERWREFTVAVLAWVLVAGSSILLVSLSTRPRTHGAVPTREQSDGLAQACDRANTGALEARIAIAKRTIEDIDAVMARGNDAIHFLDAIVAHLPNGTRLREVRFGDGRVSIIGTADSADAATAFVARLRGMSGEVRDVECSASRTIGWAPSGRGYVERVIHAFDIHARYVQQSDGAAARALGGHTAPITGAESLEIQCADAERRASEALESIPPTSEPESAIATLGRLARRAGVQVERVSALPSRDRAARFAVGGERLILLARPFEIRLLAGFSSFRRLLGEITRIATIVGVDSFAIESTAPGERFPLEARLTIAIYQRDIDSHHGATTENAP
jgi:hypothetical protein